jgi:predicted DNA-binding ribbon-helix-helix protein
MHVIVGALMSRLKHQKNHRICIFGHQTSVRLESEMWYLLRRIAVESGTTVIRLIEHISAVRNPERSLSSEIRVFVATHFARRVAQTGFFDPASRFAFRVVPAIRLSRARPPTVEALKDSPDAVTNVSSTTHGKQQAPADFYHACQISRRLRHGLHPRLLPKGKHPVRIALRS